MGADALAKLASPAAGAAPAASGRDAAARAAEPGAEQSAEASAKRQQAVALLRELGQDVMADKLDA
eukprot:5786300-Alexandrium_andersonii.AAC.1